MNTRTNEFAFNKQIDELFFKNMQIKVSQLESLCQKLSKIWIIGSFGRNFAEFVRFINGTIKIIIENLDLLINIEKIFYDDFITSIFKIDKSIDIFIKVLSYKDLLEADISFTHKIKKELDYFALCANIFMSNINEILLKLKETKEKEDEIVDSLLGIESALFNFSYNIEYDDEYKFISTKNVTIYTCLNSIQNINDNLVYLQSYFGTGKSLCLPIILLCKIMKDQLKVPFLLMTQPSEKLVKSKSDFFNNIISKYVEIIYDEKTLCEMYNNYEKTTKMDKAVLGILTPKDLLFLMNNLRKNHLFYSSTQFLIDEVQERTIFTDVLISKMSEYHQTIKPLNVVLTSSLIEPSITNLFKGKLKTINLITKSRYEVVSQKPILENDIDKINSIIVPNEVVRVIKEMSKVESNVKKGNILCFLSKLEVCQQIKIFVSSSFMNSKETKNRKKIIILKTSLKNDEPIQSFLGRLHEEILLNEKEKTDLNEYLYILPIIIHENSSNTVYKLIENDFSKDLLKINKLILSTSMTEFSFNIENLSVVVDSGLMMEEQFNCNYGHSEIIETQATNDIMLKRKGKLGKTTNGLYIPIQSTEISDFQTPQIQRLDLTSAIFWLKTIKFDFEEMKNLPNKPNFKNLCHAMDNLMYIGAINTKTLKISKFGIEMANYPFLPIYYSAAVAECIKLFKNEDKMIGKFIFLYIALILQMGSDLVKENNNMNLNKYFNESSDIITIVNPLNVLLKCEYTNDDQIKHLVESIGFSYSTFKLFKKYIQSIVDLIFPNMKISKVINESTVFIKKHNKFSSFIEIFISKLIDVNPKLENYYTINFQYINNIEKYENCPNLVFQRQSDNAKISISKRPGWNKIVIPTKCYCFNYSNNNGYMIHIINSNNNNTIQSIECDEKMLIPWFSTLLRTYLPDNKIKYLTCSNKIKGTNLYYSTFDNKIYLTLIQSNEYKYVPIIDSISKCKKLIPFVPRSALIFRRDVDCLVEVKSIGTDQYKTRIIRDCNGKILSKSDIDYCLKHLEELARSDSRIRICFLFTRQSCSLNDIDTKYLYFIDNSISNHLMDTIHSRIGKLNTKPILKEYPHDLDSFLTFRNNKEINKIIGCLDICNKSSLTRYPIYVYNEDGSIYTSKMCRDCIISSLQYATNEYFKNGIIDEDKLDNIYSKPSIIPTIECKHTNDKKYHWPQIPLGQLINVLIKEDKELSSLVSAWLIGISEYTIRTQDKENFIFCPDHPHIIFNINKQNNIECVNKTCHNVFCTHCKKWHNSSNKCQNLMLEEEKSYKKCPKCNIPTFKEGGCNHIQCVCGTHWCFKCGKGFSSSDECYSHLNKIHGGYFDYDINH